MLPLQQIGSLPLQVASLVVPRYARTMKKPQALLLKPSKPLTEFEQIVHALAQVPKSEITSPFSPPKKKTKKKRAQK